MLKFFIIALLLSFSAFATLKSNEKVTLQKSFWCTAVSGEETIDFSVLVTKRKQDLIISFPQGSYNIKKIPVALDISDLLLEDKSLFLADKLVEIDDLKCTEASVETLLKYKKGLL